MSISKKSRAGPNAFMPESALVRFYLNQYGGLDVQEAQEKEAPVKPVGVSREQRLANAKRAREAHIRNVRERKRLAAEDLRCKDKALHPYGRLDIDFIKAAERLKAAGLTDDDLVWVFGLSNRERIACWKVDDPAFRQACLAGKETAVRHLVAAGFRAATGYDCEDSSDRYVIDKETGEKVLVGRMVYKRHVPPNITALMFMLCHLDKRWHSPNKFEIRNELKTLNVTIDGKLDSERIERLARKLLPSNTEDDSGKFVMAAEVSNGVGG